MADLGAIGFGLPLNAAAITGPVISGNVLDASAAPAARSVVVVLRATTQLIRQTESDPADGTYSLPLPFSSAGVEHQVICQDNAAGSLENDLIHRVIP